jgi:hypothetical protein
MACRKSTLSGAIGDVRAAGGTRSEDQCDGDPFVASRREERHALPAVSTTSVRLHETEKGYRLDDLELKVAESSECVAAGRKGWLAPARFRQREAAVIDLGSAPPRRRRTCIQRRSQIAAIGRILEPSGR